MSRRCLGLVLVPLLAFEIAVAETSPSWPGDGGAGELPEPALLAVGVAAFEPARRIDAEHSAALRASESNYVAYLLRSTLEEARRWGPVRMLPEPDPTAELGITGRILDSEPGRLSIHVTARDATGRIWLDRGYTREADRADYGAEGWIEPFRPLYDQLAADLEAARRGLGLSELERIIEVSRLRHAATLAPAAFGDYFSVGENGAVTLKRLPAEDDPLLRRAARVREAEYLFVDTVDRRLGQFVREVGPTYSAWRRATLEADALMAEYASGTGNRDRRGRLRRSYNAFRELKLYQQTQAENLEAFAFEVGPTRLELSGELVELEGSLQAQYARWQDLIQRIHLETVGLPENTDDG